MGVHDVSMHDECVHDVSQCNIGVLSVGVYCVGVHGKDVPGVRVRKTRCFFSVVYLYLMPIKEKNANIFLLQAAE